jgi:hypothetical protein
VAAVSAAEKYCPTCEKSFEHGKRCPNDGTELVILGAAQDPLLGRSLNDRYTIDVKLGAGGMGTVYRGTQHSVGREVAIKVVSPRLVSDPDAIKRFLREAKLASKLGHPNAVAILDFGQTSDGLFFLVMELLVGRTLDRVLRADGRLPLPRVARIASQICDALEGAHRLDVVHRDLKPANVMLLDSERDLVKVLDFGLAKSLTNDSGTTSMTGSGALLGTPAYMSPEAALGREVDARADLYSLGCMLYVLASGRQPFYADTSHELISMQANVVPSPPPGVPGPLSDVIMRLLEKDPAKRYQTAVDTREAIEAAVVASRMATPLALERTLPQGLPAIPDAGMATTVDTIAPAHAVAARSAPAKSSSEAAPAPAVSIATAAPAPRKAPLWLPIAGLAVIGGAIAFFVLRDPPSTPTKPEPVVQPVAPDAEAVASGVDAAPVVETVIDAAVVVVVDAAVIDAPKRTTKKTIDAGSRIEATVAPPDAGVVAPPPIDAAPVAPPPDSSDGRKTPW